MSTMTKSEVKERTESKEFRCQREFTLQGYDFEPINEDHLVLSEAAKNNYEFDEQVDDESLPMQLAVARRGYDLDILDEDKSIRKSLNVY